LEQADLRWLGGTSAETAQAVLLNPDEKNGMKTKTVRSLWNVFGLNVETHLFTEAICNYISAKKEKEKARRDGGRIRGGRG